MARAVRDWLESIGLARYADSFEENDLDLDLIADLSENDLKDLGVESMGHRKRILRAIGELADQFIGTPSAVGSITTTCDQDAVPEPQAERRQITIMFCDLVGSTKISSEMDPEDMREVIRAYQNTVAGEVSRFEGHVAKFMGDGIMVLFGYPQAHEDDPERAIRTAMAIVDGIQNLRFPTERKIELRIGIATGPVVVGDLVGEGAAQEEAVVGDTPNLAARLQALASPGDIFVAPATRDLAGNTFNYADKGEQKIKGLPEPIRIWRVEGERGFQSRFEERRRRWTALFGRRAEVDLLLERWHRAQNGEGQAVILSGDAGIGKSRIVEALNERLASDDHSFLRFQCSPYHASSAFYPIISHIKGIAGFTAADSDDDRLDKLAGWLSQTSAHLRQANLPLFGELLSLKTSRLLPVESTAQQKKTRTLEALAELFAGLASTRPILLVFEDVHWADPSTLELLSLLLERLVDQPILTVITHRPEFVSTWQDFDYVVVLNLKRLGREHCAEIVRSLADGKEMPAEVCEEIISRADGVPLFLEELTVTILGSGLLHERQNRFELTGPLPRLAIPDTLQDLLTARLDQYPRLKKVAQIGAVIGREFAHELIVAVASQDGHKIEEMLDQLVKSELLVRRGQPPDADYVFRHVLVRDAAYESLLKSARRQHHASVARILTERFPTVVENEPEIVAYHFSEATMVFEAISYWQKAAQRAIERSANIEAETHLAKGLEILHGIPATDERLRLEAGLQNIKGVCLMPTRGFGSPEVADAFSTAASISETVNDTRGRFLALRGLGQYQMISGDLRGAADQTRRVMTLAAELGDHGALVEAHHLGWITLTFTGDFEAARDHAHRGIELYDRDRDHELTHIYSGHDPGVCCRSFGALPLWQLGYLDQALALSRQGQELAAELGHPFSETVALWATCQLHQLRRDRLPTLETAEALIARSVEGGFALMKAMGELLKAWALVEQGDLVAGMLGLRRGVEHLRADGTEFSLPSYFALLGEAYGRKGDIDEGLSAINEGFAVAERNRDHFNLPELHRVKGELILAQSAKNRAAAAACFERAIRVARDQKAKPLELRASVSLARLWSSSGRRKEAYDLLDPIYQSFSEGFESPDLEDARIALDGIR